MDDHSDKDVAEPLLRGLSAWPWYLQFMRDPLGCLEAGQKRFGPVFALSPAPFKKNGIRKHVAVFTPECNRIVLSDPTTFRLTSIGLKGPTDSAMSRLRVGFHSPQGVSQQLIRKQSLPLFSRKAMQACQAEIAAATEESARRWPLGTAVDMSKLLRDLFLDLSCRLLFGNEPVERARLLSELVEEYVRRSYFSWAMLLPFDVPGSPYRSLRKVCEQLTGVLETMVKERRASSSPSPDLLERMIRSIDDSTGSSAIDLVGPANFLFIASFETLATSMTWMLFLLAQHPEVLAELYEELALHLEDAVPTLDRVERLPVLESVVLESLRLLPPVPLIFRKASRDLNLGGIDMRNGDWVFCSQYLTQRMPDLFPDPNQFQPQRWLGIKPDPYAYFPFGVGPRSCIGYSLGMTVFKISLAILVQRLRFTVVANSRIDRSVKVTLSPRRGMPMVLQSQDGQFQSVPVRGQIRDMIDLPPARTVSVPGRTPASTIWRRAA